MQIVTKLCPKFHVGHRTSFCFKLVTETFKKNLLSNSIRLIQSLVTIWNKLKISDKQEILGKVQQPFVVFYHIIILHAKLGL